MGTVAGIKKVELRVYDNPKSPGQSTYTLYVPVTVLDAVIDPNSRQTLAEILSDLQRRVEAVERRAGVAYLTPPPEE